VRKPAGEDREDGITAARHRRGYGGLGGACHYCAGVGLELAPSAGIRVAAARSAAALPEMKLGMIPGSGGMRRLARLIILAQVLPAGDAAPEAGSR
jgi:hypothetical protein